MKARQNISTDTETNTTWQISTDKASWGMAWAPAGWQLRLKEIWGWGGCTEEEGGGGCSCV